MQRVVFLDTSVLLNVLDVPDKNGEKEAILPRFRELAKSGTALMVIPMAAVIEVGNHIAQLENGAVRRQRMERFADFLRQSLSGRPPWVVSGAIWDAVFLSELVEGHQERPGMVDLSSGGVGAGDGSILLELERYRQRSDVPSKLPVELWSLDQGLQAYG